MIDHPKRKTPLNSGQFYTGLSRAETSEGIKLVNFHEDVIKVNQKALLELLRMRRESPLNAKHPASSLSGSILSLLNIRSWNMHFQNFLSDPIHLNHCNIFCFTETHLNVEPRLDETDLSENWNSVFKHTEHGLALCYNSDNIELVEEFQMTNNIEIMACHLQSDLLMVSDFILIIVYRKPGAIGNFFTDLREELQRLPTGYRTIIVGDFNFDLRLLENNDFVHLFFNDLDLSQRTNFSTHIEGGILDLVIDSKLNNENIVQWQPTPFSDHFVLYYAL